MVEVKRGEFGKVVVGCEGTGTHTRIYFVKEYLHVF